MARSLPRPISRGACSREMVSPLLPPSTITTWVGTPRRGLGLFSCLVRALRSEREGPPASWRATRAPNMSERITEMHESTKIHRIARYAKRIRTRVSSDKGGSPSFEVQGHGRAADPDRRTIGQRRLFDPLAVHRHPVGRAEVVHGDPGFAAFLGLLDADLDVLAGDPRVVDAEVGLVAAADHDAGRCEGKLFPIQLERGRGPSYLRVAGVTAGQLGAGDGLAAHPEAAGRQVVTGLQGDADRTGEHVGLLGGVLAQHLGELA